MAKDISAAVRELCLGFPDAEEFLSHGTPNFRARGGRVFATYAVNHHGDGRIALWLPAAPGVQQAQVELQDGDAYFVPPYVGPRGWLGVRLERGLDWDEIGLRVHEAYALVAAAKQRRRLGPPPRITPPTLGIDPAEFDPLAVAPACERVAAVRALCLALPGTREESQYGSPAWRVGKQAFAAIHLDGRQPRLACRVGLEQQSLYAADPRYRIPPYFGHQGWITLELGADDDPAELRGLVVEAWRGSAPKKLLAQLDA